MVKLTNESGPHKQWHFESSAAQHLTCITVFTKNGVVSLKSPHYYSSVIISLTSKQWPWSSVGRKHCQDTDCRCTSHRYWLFDTLSWNILSGEGERETVYYGGRKKKEQTHLLCSSKRSIYHFLREMKEAEKEKKKDPLAVLKAINHFTVNRLMHYRSLIAKTCIYTTFLSLEEYRQLWVGWERRWADMWPLPSQCTDLYAYQHTTHRSYCSVNGAITTS